MQQKFVQNFSNNNFIGKISQKSLDIKNYIQKLYVQIYNFLKKRKIQKIKLRKKGKF